MDGRGSKPKKTQKLIKAVGAEEKRIEPKLAESDLGKYDPPIAEGALDLLEQGKHEIASAEEEEMTEPDSEAVQVTLARSEILRVKANINSSKNFEKLEDLVHQCLSADKMYHLEIIINEVKRAIISSQIDLGTHYLAYWFIYMWLAS